MRFFLIFIVSLVFSVGTSYILIKHFNVDVSPTTISLLLMTIMFLLPDKWMNKITGNDYE